LTPLAEDVPGLVVLGKVVNRMPLMVICFEPAALMVPMVPLTPSTRGAVDMVVTAGQAVAQASLQALVLESLTSLVEK
jgi:hypothetical protein